MMRKPPLGKSSAHTSSFQTPAVASGALIGSSGAAFEEEIKITIGDVEYLLILNQENFLPLDVNTPVLVLVSLTQPGQSISRTALRDFRATSLEQDDVFHPEFYSNIVFYGSKEDSLQIEPDAIEELEAWNTKTRTFVEGSPSFAVAAGPYVFAKNQTWQPWKIYYDFNATFMIVVKDNMDIAGHKTTLCNRAWEELYPAASRNAACIQVLLDAGVIVLGKTKLEAMVMDEEPLECVEFTAPFNPRGDGYQNPSGSSSGSAAGISSYDWLDFSLGSDTNGSGCKPADYNGCFSIRPSTGIMDTSGVVGHFPKFDMPVLFGRDISKFSEFISVWYGTSPMLRSPSKAQVKILYPSDYLPTTNSAQSQVIDNFVKELETALQVSRVNISLAKEWKKDCPDGPNHLNIAEYLKLVGSKCFLIKITTNSSPGWRDIAKGISQEERDKYWRRSEIYRHWLLDNIFKAHDKTTMTIMILPIEKGEPNYRDVDPPLHGMLDGFDTLNMSPMMRAPELTTIAGEIPYDSIVAKRPEPRPIGVSIIGAPGMDLILAKLVEKGMNAGGISTSLKTGRSTI
ncbi:hypothetical protein B7494_g2658 [Chlorociboria aeruginascens]|nr:hypothetical protein B7494_g2658 [Chlorociboria aeruginascens]